MRAARLGHAAIAQQLSLNSTRRTLHGSGSMAQRRPRVLSNSNSSAYQTQAKQDEALRANAMRARLGVAVLSAAAISLGVDLDAQARAAIEPQTKQRWHLFDQIGEGSYGTVRIGMCENSGEVAAVKIVEPDQRNYPALEREISALKLIKALGGHRNIVDLRDVYVDGRKVCLVTELARGGELFEYIITNGVLSEQRASTLAKDLASALGFMHRYGLVHKDIKPENILLSAREDKKSDQSQPNVTKLADFGSAGPATAACAPQKLDDIGTSAYSPPELLQSGICTSACDMWALGCVLYIALSGSHPFDLEGTATEKEMEFRIVNMPVTFDFAAWTNISADAKDLVSKLLEKDPARRPTADQLLLHPWIQSPAISQVAHLAAMSAAACVQV